MNYDGLSVALHLDDDRLRQIRRLTEVSRILTSELSVDDVLTLAVSQSAALFGARQSVLMCSDDSGRWSLQASHGIDTPSTDQIANDHDEPLDVQLTGLLGVALDNLLAVPLVVSGKVFGVLGVVLDESTSNPDADEWCLSAFADQVAVALEKSRLDQAAAFRERLLGIVGHDLRNPLQAIQMTAMALSYKYGNNEDVSSLAQRIAHNSEQMGIMIAQLLDFTRSRLGGGIELGPEPMDLTSATRQAISNLSAAYPHATFETSLVGSVTGEWDRQRIEQVIYNLIGNAVQHGDTLKPIGVAVGEDQGDAVLRVHNFGTAITTEAQRELFSPFRRTHQARSADSKGLGLGLYIANEIAVAHGGAINVRSSDRDGTEFSVRLPVSGVHATSIFRPL